MFSVECETVGRESLGHVTIGCETVGCETVGRETVGHETVGRDHRTFFLAVILERISFLFFPCWKIRRLTIFIRHVTFKRGHFVGDLINVYHVRPPSTAYPETC